ncbi:hypothetical protein ZJ03_27865 [Salmonella enterica subsp. enterica serovar Typhi]|nr:hypothetical protein [Salmonella enterica subsp. enterica serovar Typhi]
MSIITAFFILNKQKNRQRMPAVLVQLNFESLSVFLYLVVTISPSGNTLNAGLSERLPSSLT